VCAEYIRSCFTAARSSFLLTELSRAGFGDLDLGWGRPVYGARRRWARRRLGRDELPRAYTNADGEDGVIAPVSLLVHERRRRGPSGETCKALGTGGASGEGGSSGRPSGAWLQGRRRRLSLSPSLWSLSLISVSASLPWVSSQRRDKASAKGEGKHPAKIKRE